MQLLPPQLTPSAAYNLKLLYCETVSVTGSSTQHPQQYFTYVMHNFQPELQVPVLLQFPDMVPQLYDACTVRKDMVLSAPLMLLNELHRVTLSQCQHDCHKAQLKETQALAGQQRPGVVLSSTESSPPLHIRSHAPHLKVCCILNLFLITIVFSRCFLPCCHLLHG